MVIHRTIPCWLLTCITTHFGFPLAYGVEESWNAKFQTTYIWQSKAPFSAVYSGRNSLSTEREKSYSFTGTAFLGMRPWAGGELYFNPEVVQGVPLSNLTGLGGLTNGEIAAPLDPSQNFTWPEAQHCNGRMNTRLSTALVAYQSCVERLFARSKPKMPALGAAQAGASVLWCTQNLTAVTARLLEKCLTLKTVSNKNKTYELSIQLLKVRTNEEKN